MPSNAARKLEQLAQAWAEDRLGKRLHRGEIAVVRAAADGEWADLHESIERGTQHTDPAKADTWHEHRTIRPELIAYLLTHDDARPLIHRTGVQIGRARFKDPLDLRNIETKLPLKFVRCRFERGISLDEAELATVWIRTCSAEALPDEFPTNGSVTARLTKIRGDLSLNGSHLATSIGDALNLQNATVEGGAFFTPDGPTDDRHRFEATGTLYMPGCTINGLDLSGATLNPETGHALYLQGATIEGGAVFRPDGPTGDRHRFEATGTLHMSGCTINGQLAMNGATLNPEEGHALNLQRSTIEGGAFFRPAPAGPNEDPHPFEATGTLHMFGCTIRQGLDMCGVEVSNTVDQSVDLELTTVHGDIWFSRKAQERVVAASVNRGVRLVRAHIKGSIHMHGACFSHPDAWKRTDHTGKTQATLDLYNATIDGALELGLKLDQAEPSISGRIDLRHARVGMLADYEETSGSVAITNPVVIFQDFSTSEQGLTWLLDGLEYNGFASGTDQHWNSRLRWLRHYKEKGGIPKYIPQPYEQLAKVLRSRGYDGAARHIGYAKLTQRLRALKQSSSPGIWPIARLVWGRILQTTVGFGYYPWRIFIWISTLFVIGSLMYLWAESSSVHTPTAPLLYATRDSDNNYRPYEDPPEQYTNFDPFLYSLDTMVPFLDIHQETSWRIDGSAYPGQWFRAYEIAHIFGGWALTTLGVVGFSGILKRD